MFLSAHEIARSRDHALSNLLGLSDACLAAGQRFSELFSSTGREAIQHGSKHWSLFGHGQIESMTQFPTTLWLENSARSSRLLDSALEILSETQKAMIRNAEAQVRVVDEIVMATINRATKASPWEVEIGLRAVKSALETAETTLQGISAAAIETVDLAENEIHQIATSTTENKLPARKRAARPTANH